MVYISYFSPTYLFGSAWSGLVMLNLHNAQTYTLVPFAKRGGREKARAKGNRKKRGANASTTPRFPHFACLPSFLPSFLPSVFPSLHSHGQGRANTLTLPPFFCQQVFTTYTNVIKHLYAKHCMLPFDHATTLYLCCCVFVCVCVQSPKQKASARMKK